jgi:hypothetical protein
MSKLGFIIAKHKKSKAKIKNKLLDFVVNIPVFAFNFKSASFEKYCSKDDLFVKTKNKRPKSGKIIIQKINPCSKAILSPVSQKQKN